ncbi:MAG: hypothetical protein BWY88_00550 [Synergistetes bacterium ADurb.Bin520]|nr:MAG: hypothetical protein BWY88_00550 [Synergistetes bacterium ADurb.Bin520]
MKAALGDGVKRLAPAEAGNYGTTNRSVLALGDIAAGETLTRANSALLRSEKNLRPGMRPELWDLALGRPLVRPVPAGQGVRLEDLLGGK